MAEPVNQVWWSNMNGTKLAIGTLGMLLALGAVPGALADGGPEDPSITVPDPQNVFNASGIQTLANTVCVPSATPSGACAAIISAAQALAATICDPAGPSGACNVIITELTQDCAAGPGPECDVTIALSQVGAIIGGAATAGSTAAVQAGLVLAQAIATAGQTRTAAQGIVTDKLGEADDVQHAVISHVTGYAAAGVGTVTGAIKANVCDYDGAEAPQATPSPSPQASACGVSSTSNPLTDLADFLTASVNTFKNGITTAPACNNAVSAVTSVHNGVGTQVGNAAQCSTNAPAGSDVPDL